MNSKIKSVEEFNAFLNEYDSFEECFRAMEKSCFLSFIKLSVSGIREFKFKNDSVFIKQNITIINAIIEYLESSDAKEFFCDSDIKFFEAILNNLKDRGGEILFSKNKKVSLILDGGRLN